MVQQSCSFWKRCSGRWCLRFFHSFCRLDLISMNNIAVIRLPVLQKGLMNSATSVCPSIRPSFRLQFGFLRISVLISLFLHEVLVQ